MRYELTLILRPDFSEEEQKAEIEKVKARIAENKGQVLKEEVWGKRVLAYPLKHFSEGVYVLLNFETTPAKVKDLEKRLNLEDKVLRSLIVRK